MERPRGCRVLAGPLALLVAAAVPAFGPPVAAQAPTMSCRDAGHPTPEKWGPTDVNAVTGNGRLSVGLNRRGTVSVFKWPSPSYYDQIKYRTRDRGAPRMGALPNEGAFLGMAWRRASGGREDRWGFSWLRSWRTTQRFARGGTDEVITVHKNRRLGLRVRVRDVVGARRASLVRAVKVTRSRRSPVRTIRLFAFANYNPVVSKIRQNPVADWCTEERNDAGARYVSEDDLVFHERSGIDESTGQPRSVAVGLAFGSASDGHQVGQDTYQTNGGTSAFDDAADGRLGGSDQANGQADAALYQQHRLGRGRSARAKVIMAAAPGYRGLRRSIAQARALSSASIRRQKTAWWRSWLSGAALPRGAPSSVTRLAKRALISLRQAVDPATGTIVTSIATQAPYGLDWVRHGAYINRALHEAGHPDMVDRHNRRYGALQASATSKPPGGEATPIGNWSENFYSDGVVGGSVPYEIDATGLGIWTLWDHYRRTGDLAYIRSGTIYGAIQRAAHYLSDDTPVGCRDPATGLHCPAHEDGGQNPTRTLAGAQAAWLGLDAAMRSARAQGRAEALVNAERWKARRDELRAAIHQHYFDESCNCFTMDSQTGGALLWPVGLVGTRSSIAEAQAARNWRPIAAAMAGRRTVGGLETRVLLGNAHVWSGTSTGKRRLERALRWVAERTSTPRTGLLGEAWMRYPEENGPITTMVSQPHVWSQAMFYLAALETYGRRSWRF